MKFNVLAMKSPDKRHVLKEPRELGRKTPAAEKIHARFAAFSQFGNVIIASALSACLAFTSGAWVYGFDSFGFFLEPAANASQGAGSGKQVPKASPPEFEKPIADKPYTEASTERKLNSLVQITFEKRELPAEAETPAVAEDSSCENASEANLQAEFSPSGESGVAETSSSWHSSQFANMTQADFAGKTISEKVELIGAMARQDMHESGILASITAAQAILESGWMKSGLAKHNNLFGIKASKKVNVWEGTTWTGTYVEMKTSEEYVEGEHTIITAKFRTYPSVWASIKDHSSYLANCYNGDHKRYEGIVGCRDPKTGFQIIKDGGYATSSTYVESLMKVVDKYDLTRFDS